MKIVSVSVGLPREVEWNRKVVRTAIFKTPVDGPVHVGTLNLNGDQQADLSVHGGVDKAVYAYPSEHYSFWREELSGTDLPWGWFGENLTTEGLLEDNVFVGDRFRIGSAEFVVTQPRMPCFKLGIRFGDPSIIKRFLRSGRSGFYLAVLKEGELTAGDAIDLSTRAKDSLSIADITGLYSADVVDEKLLRRASELPSLPLSWREYFRKQLATL